MRRIKRAVQKTPIRQALIAKLEEARNDDMVRFAYVKTFDIKFDTTDRHDVYTRQIFFEFKYSKNFGSLRALAEVLAQALYYIHKLKFGISDKPIPPIICLADKNEAAFTDCLVWKEYYTDEPGIYDWDLPPSSPDKKLVNDLLTDYELRKVHVYKLDVKQELNNFIERIEGYLSPQLKLVYADKKLITEENFEDVYKFWELSFGEAVYNGHKPSKYFVSDVQEGNTRVIAGENKLLFRITANDFREKQIMQRDYEYFWSLYEKVKNPHILRGIISKMDRLTDDSLRRFHGEFFTPLDFANKGLQYLERRIGKEWWKHGYKMWDMAAGTGNLQYHLPYEAWDHLYLSTYYPEEVEHLSKLYPESVTFQYDYLNDDVDSVFQDIPFNSNWKMPHQLRQDLVNPNIKWIILINPPFATSQTAGTSGKSKKDVSTTRIRSFMHQQELGEVSRELFAQFLFRIHREFRNKVAHLGLYSKLKYINANNDQRFRDEVFQYKFEGGFIFSSANFSGTARANAFPVGFIIWDLSQPLHLEEQSITVDIYNNKVEKIGTKRISNENRSRFLNKWIDRPAGVKNFPPFKSAIVVATENIDVRDRISEGFLGSLMCKGNELMNQNSTAIFSGPYVSAGGLSIDQDNFEKSMIVHAVRRTLKSTWINDRDQFLTPSCELDQVFIADCVVWSLFANSNETTALKDVQYKGAVYQIHNHFFPFKISKINAWDINNAEIRSSLMSDQNRFVANWLSGKQLSEQARAVMYKAEEIYKIFFEHLNNIRTHKLKIQTWDAGWWQIRNGLSESQYGNEQIEELKILHGILKTSILPKIFEYGFLIN